VERDTDEYGYDTKRQVWVYNQNLSIADALSLTDLDYDIFLKENADIFRLWKGALSHEQLCKIDLNTRFKYIKEVNKQIKERNEANKSKPNTMTIRKR
jgi:hypothetical protein